MELLAHDVIEDILERLALKTLCKFKSVSKQWKSTIQTPSFQKRQMSFHHKESADNPDVLLVSLYDVYVCKPDVEAMRTLVLGPSVSIKIPTHWENKLYQVCTNSCDGLICLYDKYDDCIVVNPSIRWHRTLPPCSYQKMARESCCKRCIRPISFPGFGKDKINGTYKLVWLYNSAAFGLNDNATTTCEVFDFTTKAWRYVVPSSHYMILHLQEPVYFDGSLHWFTAPHYGETKILSFNLHTETFQIISKSPFSLRLPFQEHHVQPR